MFLIICTKCCKLPYGDTNRFSVHPASTDQPSHIYTQISLTNSPGSLKLIYSSCRQQRLIRLGERAGRSGPCREKSDFRVCEQHMRRPACASAQSDQRLCYTLFGKYHI